MFYNCLSKPILTKKQIKLCTYCPWFNVKKHWCCKIGFWVREKPKIIIPNKKVISPEYAKIGKVKPKAEASEKEATNRFNICKSCEFYNKEKNRCMAIKGCSSCGDYVISKKIKWANAHCPVKKW